MKSVLIFFLWVIFFLINPFIGRAVDLEEEAYDVNTEIVLSGKLKEVIIPERGMVSWEIERGGKVYKIFLCPRWYYRHINPFFSIGDPVEIRGSKVFNKRYGLIFIARSIKNLKNKEEILLRGRGCKPYWRGGRVKEEF